MDDLGDAARVNMLEQLFNDHILIGYDVRYYLLLLPIDEKLDNFAEIAGKDGIDGFFIASLATAFFGRLTKELEQAIEKHILAWLLVIRVLGCVRQRRVCL